MRKYYFDDYDPLKCPVERVYEKDDNGKIVKYSEHMHHLAYVEDGSSYYAALVTRPDFGCVLWEAE
jgi:hypothetical protein